MSLLLQFVFHIHEDWLGLENPMLFHIGVGIFYLVLFYTIGQWVRGQLLYGPVKKPSTTLKTTSSTPTLGNNASLTKLDTIANKLNSK